jgi:hypothetical protein
VARDATARQSDVEAKSVKLAVLTDSGSYRPGLITFTVKKGGSFDLEKLRSNLQGTRLSGRTRMQVKYLEITATGTVMATGKELVLKVAGTNEQFQLGEDPDAKPKEKDKEKQKSVLTRLREAVAKGEKVTSVTGRVQGWTGVFPVVLKALLEEQKKEPEKRKPNVLFVTGFEVGKE